MKLYDRCCRVIAQQSRTFDMKGLPRELNELISDYITFYAKNGWLQPSRAVERVDRKLLSRIDKERMETEKNNNKKKATERATANRRLSV